jgi:hypothetical protein
MNHISYEGLKTIYYNTKILIGSIRFIQNSIYIITVPYKDPINYTKLQIKVNDQYLKLTKYINYDKYEGIVILEYTDQYLNNISNIIVEYKYNELNGIIKLQKEDRKYSNLCCMTLFLNDYQLIESYVTHYLNLGVECFYLYYNNYIKNLISKNDFNNIINKLKNNNNNITIYFIECPISYFDNRLKESSHCAQLIAINDFVILSKTFNKFVITNDLDEYFYLTEDFLLEENKAYIIENKFSSINEIYKEDMIHQLNKKTKISGITCGPIDRIKLIFDPKSVEIPAVHKPHKYECLVNTDNTKIFHCHFVNYKNYCQMTSRNCSNYIQNLYEIILSDSKKFIFK